MTQSNNSKKLFLVASLIEDKLRWLESAIPKIVTNSAVFTARDGLEALDKLQNYPPHVLITDLDLGRLNGQKLIEQALKIKATQHTAIIIAAIPTKQTQHVDELVSGKIQYFTGDQDQEELATCVNNALLYVTQSTVSDFKLIRVPAGKILLHEGDKAEFVYFVKSGNLVAYREVDGKEVVLGSIGYGEFVGEMAYINGEPRNATVKAVTDCELIEVPIGRFEKVLFQQPTWSKALMLTLTKRLRAANNTKQSAD